MCPAPPWSADDTTITLGSQSCVPTRVYQQNSTPVSFSCETRSSALFYAPLALTDVGLRDRTLLVTGLHHHTTADNNLVLRRARGSSFLSSLVPGCAWCTRHRQLDRKSVV